MGSFNFNQKLSMLLLLYLLFLETGRCLKITSIYVPRVLSNGDSDIFKCYFNLQGKPLYSLTWWKDDIPFFKFVPVSDSKISIFSLPGIFVDSTRSTMHEVFLSNVDFRASGKFRCEVVADESFEKESKEQNMVVIDKPNVDPKILGRTVGYRTGDLLLLNCSSFFSFPAANLSWYINGRQASYETVVSYPTEGDGEGRLLSKSGIQMFIKPSHYKSGVLELRCVATILDKYRKSAAVVIIDPEFREPPREGKVAQSTESSSSSSNNSHFKLGILYILFAIKSSGLQQGS